MTTKPALTIFVSFLISLPVWAMSNEEEGRNMVESMSWSIQVRGEEMGSVKFLSNQTIEGSKFFKLGNKEYKFWQIAKHPFKKGKIILKVQADKNSGWYTFMWKDKQAAWVSSSWPNHKIIKGQ